MKKTILTLGTIVLLASGCNQKEAPATPSPDLVPVQKTEYKAPTQPIITPVVKNKEWADYTVKKGDDLTKIGREYNWGHNPSREYFTKIQTKNGLKITPQTDTQMVEDNFFIYDRGDFWYSNGRTFVGDGLCDKIYPGQKLYVPLKK